MLHVTCRNVVLSIPHTPAGSATVRERGRCGVLDYVDEGLAVQGAACLTAHKFMMLGQRKLWQLL
jgi:hypothetical protein